MDLSPKLRNAGRRRAVLSRAVGASDRAVREIRAHAFGSALGLLVAMDGREAPLIAPEQVALLLRVAHPRRDLPGGPHAPASLARGH